MCNFELIILKGMDNEPIVKFEINTGVATITLNRPEACNSLDDDTLQMIIGYLVQIENHEDVFAVIIRATGNHFCSGADVKWAKKSAQFSNEVNSTVTRALANMLRKLYTSKKTTITITQGAVYGGGIGFLACSDFVLALPNSVFCFPEVKLGLVPAVISPYVISILGEQMTRRYFLTADPFSVERAYQLGLIHEIVEPEKLENRIVELIHNLRNNGPKAMQIAKKLIIELSEGNKTVESNMIHTSNLLASLCTSKEGQEGLTAFIEKRAPRWSKPDATS